MIKSTHHLEVGLVKKVILISIVSLIILLATSCIGVVPQATRTPDITTPAYTEPLTTTPPYTQFPTQTPAQTPATAKVVKVYGTPN